MFLKVLTHNKNEKILNGKYIFLFCFRWKFRSQRVAFLAQGPDIRRIPRVLSQSNQSHTPHYVALAVCGHTRGSGLVWSCFFLCVWAFLTVSCLLLSEDKTTTTWCGYERWGFFCVVFPRMCVVKKMMTSCNERNFLANESTRDREKVILTVLRQDTIVHVWEWHTHYWLWKFFAIFHTCGC